MSDIIQNALKKEIETWIPAHIQGGEIGDGIKEPIMEWAGIVASHFYEFGIQNFKIFLSGVINEKMSKLWEKLPDADNPNPTQMELRYLGRYMALEGLLDDLNEL